MRVRLEPLGEDALALARAVAVLGPGAPLRHASLLAVLEMDRAAHGLDLLVEIDLAAPGSRCGSHTRWSPRPCMRTYPQHSGRAGTCRLPGSCRASTSSSRAWRRPAPAPAEGDPWVASTLTDAALSAAAEGATELAARFSSAACRSRPRMPAARSCSRISDASRCRSGVRGHRAAAGRARPGRHEHTRGEAGARVGSRADGRRRTPPPQPSSRTA